MTNKHIILYYKKHYDKYCSCSYCVNKKGIIQSFQRLGYTISIEKLNCDWDYFYPADKHFDYAFVYQNKIFGEFMFEADKMPMKVIEFAKNYFDYIICGSQFLYDTWKNSGVEEKYLIKASLGLDMNIFNTKNCNNIIYPDKFKFLSVGAWQHHFWHDRKGHERLITVFKKLFSRNKNVMLVIKTDMNAPLNVGLENIKIIRDKWSEIDMANLYKCCALNGAYVSLHTGEGFGRTCLEALYCGCKIGATGWSGVLDFLGASNSTLFPYKLSKSKLYPADYYLDNKSPNVAQVDLDVVETWMKEVVKNFKSPDRELLDYYSWDNVIQSLMYKVGEKI